jgi:hypothetical protein
MEMNRIGNVMRAACVALALGLAGAAVAQVSTSSSSTTSAFEIISVDGNHLVVRNASGTNEYTVPPDFRFNVDGKSLAVSDLRAGMKGTATVTTTTTVKPVYVTEVKKGKVLSRIARTAIVQGDDGKAREFTQTQMDERGVQIFRNGKLIKIQDLNTGDEISATIVTTAAPLVLTEKQVQASLAAAAAAPPPSPAPVPAAAAPAPAAAPAAAPAPAAEPAAEPVAEPAAEPAVVAVEEPVAEGGSRLWLWILVLAVLALILFLVFRGKGDKSGQK